MLVDRLVKLNPQRVPPEEASDSPDALALDDSAILVHRFFRSYLRGGNGSVTPEILQAMFAESRSGRDLPTKGYAADLEYCAEIDVSAVVPRLEARTDALVVVAQG